MTRAQRVILTLIVAISCIGCDQAAKTFARHTLAVNEPLKLFNDIFHLQYSENHGAMLGIGSDLPAEARFWLFTVFAGFALITILAYTLTSGKLKTMEVLALSLVLGGGLSNLIDRLARQGAVVDFVMIVVGPLRTAIFNLADLLIVVGLAILVVSNLPLFSFPPRLRNESTHLQAKSRPGGPVRSDSVSGFNTDDSDVGASGPGTSVP